MCVRGWITRVSSLWSANNWVFFLNRAIYESVFSEGPLDRRSWRSFFSCSEICGTLSMLWKSGAHERGFLTPTQNNKGPQQITQLRLSFVILQLKRILCVASAMAVKFNCIYLCIVRLIVLSGSMARFSGVSLVSWMKLNTLLTFQCSFIACWEKKYRM